MSRVRKPGVQHQPEHSREPVMNGRFLQPATLVRYNNGLMDEASDLVAVEEPLLIRAGTESMHLVRTPGDDQNLVAGHLLSLGMIGSASDIRTMYFGNYGDSVVCAADIISGSPVYSMMEKKTETIPARQFFELKELFEERQSMFHSTRATHAAALFSMDGEMLAFGEDVGRHNAFDKALGQALHAETLHRAEIAMLSSRLALELAEKASTAGISILCGFSVATSSAVEFAQTRDLTLVGRLRAQSMNIYANHWRVTG